MKQDIGIYKTKRGLRFQIDIHCQTRFYNILENDQDLSNESILLDPCLPSEFTISLDDVSKRRRERKMETINFNFIFGRHVSHAPPLPVELNESIVLILHTNTSHSKELAISHNVKLEF